MNATTAPNDTVLQGEEASLNLFRVAQEEATRRIALTQFLAANEKLLIGPLAVEVTVSGMTIKNMDNNTEEPVSSTIVITSDRLILWGSANSHTDLVLPGSAIELHAMSTEDSVYLQICVDDRSEVPLELTIVPAATDESKEKESNGSTCQRLFDALSEVIRLHPVDPNDTDDIGPMGLMASMMGGVGGFVGNGTLGENEELVCGSSKKHPEASEEERDEMLRRLDDILIVPPELERSSDVEGQFDDADDADDLL